MLYLIDRENHKTYMVKSLARMLLKKGISVMKGISDTIEVKQFMIAKFDIKKK